MKWEPFKPCSLAHFAEQRRARGDLAKDLRLPDEIWRNNLYQVLVYRTVPRQSDNWPEMIWLSIKRIDRAIIRDWRHLQRIKNELIGPEHEAIELFPAESRLVDEANQYHLYVLKDPDIRFPVGWHGRIVADHDEAVKIGARQRALRHGYDLA